MEGALEQNWWDEQEQGQGQEQEQGYERYRRDQEFREES
jgi:hypothetical protein